MTTVSINPQVRQRREKFMISLKDIQLQFSRIYICILNRVGLTLPQYTLLNALSRIPLVTMTEASKKLHITKPAITHLVDHLEKKKCLKRLTRENDRRIYLLQVTDKGRRVVNQTQSQIFRYLLQTFESLNDKEKVVIENFYASLSLRLGEVLTSEESK